MDEDENFGCVCDMDVKHDPDCNYVALSLANDCSQCVTVRNVRMRERQRIISLIDAMEDRISMVQKGWLLDTVIWKINAE